MIPATLGVRISTAILVALTLPYLLLVAYPGYGGGFDDPASVGIYGISPTRRPVPFYGEMTPFSTPSPTADRAPLAILALLIWVTLLFAFIPLSAIAAIAVIWFGRAFLSLERVLQLVAIGIVIAIQVATFYPAGGLISWLAD